MIRRYRGEHLPAVPVMLSVPGAFQETPEAGEVVILRDGASTFPASSLS